MQVELSEQEWNQVITAIAAQHPLIAKISAQLVAQRPPLVTAAGDGLDHIAAPGGTAVQ